MVGVLVLEVAAARPHLVVQLGLVLLPRTSNCKPTAAGECWRTQAASCSIIKGTCRD